MIVIITTYSQRTAVEILKEEFQGPDLASLSEGDAVITLTFKDDMLYRDVACWIGHALGCGLIVGGTIER